MFQQLKEQLKDAMRAKDAVRMAVIRSIITTCTNELVAEGKTPRDIPSNEIVQKVIARLAKQRKDSIEQFTKGGRPELAESEQAELVVLEEFLPEMMSHDDIRPVVLKKKEELSVADASGAGKLIGAVMRELSGKADGGDVKVVVEDVLAS